MKQDLINFLQKYELEYILETLKDQGIDCFSTLVGLVDEDTFDKVIPRIGDQIKIKLCLNKELDRLKEETICNPPPEKYFLIDINQSASSSSLTESTNSSSQAAIEVVPIPINTFRIAGSILNLNELLESTFMGRAIKESYKLNGNLSTTCQSYLVEIIVQYFINIQPFRRLTNEDFRNLSQLITTTFPKELPQVYFTSPIKKRFSKDNKSGVARGKLVDKYKNRLTFLRQSGVLEFNSSTTSEEVDTEEKFEFDKVKEDLLWLLHNQDPWTEVEEKWTNCYKYRKDFLNNETVDINVFLQKFPCLKNPLGHKLLDIDFKERFKCKEIFTTFESIFQKLLDFKKKSLSHGDLVLLDLINSRNITNVCILDSRHYLMVTLLPSLLPPKTYNKKGKVWYPTNQDSVNGVVALIKVPAQIEEIKENKRKIAEKYGLPVLPFVIVQGASYSEIDNIYVVYEDLFYRLNSVLKGLDICFKIIHLLNLKYPYESEHIWMFIQLGMYELHTKYDKIPNILNIVNKIKS